MHKALWGWERVAAALGMRLSPQALFLAAVAFVAGLAARGEAAT